MWGSFTDIFHFIWKQIREDNVFFPSILYFFTGIRIFIIDEVKGFIEHTVFSHQGSVPIKWWMNDKIVLYHHPIWIYSAFLFRQSHLLSLLLMSLSQTQYNWRKRKQAPDYITFPKVKSVVPVLVIHLQYVSMKQEVTFDCEVGSSFHIECQRPHTHSKQTLLTLIIYQLYHHFPPHFIHLLIPLIRPTSLRCSICSSGSMNSIVIC